MQFGMKVGKVLVAVAGATVLLGVLVGAASARNLSTSSQQIRVAFRELRFAGLSGETVCAVTVEGSFHERTTAKVVGRLVGYINAARLGPCSRGTATILSETLPWHAAYSGFEGSLPNIRSTIGRSIGVAWRIREGFSDCLARTTTEEPMTGTFNREPVTRVFTTAVVGGTIQTSCSTLGSFTSDSAPIRTPAGGTITLTLI